MSGDYFYSCTDCPEHTTTVKMDNKDEFHPLLDYCEYHQRFFSKSFPLRDTPCKDMLMNADWPCPICGETMDLYWSRKAYHYECKVHGEPKETVANEKTQGEK